jgi:hypothetical protein
MLLWLPQPGSKSTMRATQRRAAKPLIYLRLFCQPASDVLRVPDEWSVIPSWSKWVASKRTFTFAHTCGTNFPSDVRAWNF